MTADTGCVIAEAAPAKVNLYLHIRGQRPDGYHILESLAVFPSVGDYLEAEPARGISLSLAGPFADTLPISGDNLVLRAAEALSQRTGVSAGASLRLTKNLPIASGIGGGSSDAAAALRLLSRLWSVSVPADLAIGLGADVPVCMSHRPQFMSGVGEGVQPCMALPPAWMVLVNPMVSVPTAAVFNALATKTNPAGADFPAGGIATFGDLVAWLRLQRNDMEDAAIRICPPIGAVLETLSSAPLARMSGSGATCFALYQSASEAERLADDIRARQPTWWVATAPL
ncbi:MAG: 4-(cytidine 5'-diphospho)-2-C-methyl-D-erythritol kinase [Pseudomonadota bacterium]